MLDFDGRAGQEVWFGFQSLASGDMIAQRRRDFVTFWCNGSNHMQGIDLLVHTSSRLDRHMKYLYIDNGFNLRLPPAHHLPSIRPSQRSGD